MKSTEFQPFVNLRPLLSLRASSSSWRAWAANEVRRGRWLTGLLLAVQFLTVLPVVPASRSRRPGEAGAGDGASAGPDMAQSLPWFPVVGLGLGALMALVDWALRPLFALGVRDALLLALPALLTGMLHLDGFADCCDGLLGMRTPERRLEILRDSRVGAFGVVGLVLLLLLRFAALGALPPIGRAAALVVAPVLGRWAMVYAVVRFPYARATGAGSSFRGGPGHLAGASAACAAGLGVSILLLIGREPLAVALAWAGALALAGALVAAALCRWASRRLGGGLTGDVYGAVDELVELVVLLAVPAVLHALSGML